jgi:hypothetical protein
MSPKTTRRKILKLSGTALGMSAMQSVAAARNAQSDILVDRDGAADVRIVNNSTEERPIIVHVHKPGALEGTYATDTVTLGGRNAPDAKGNEHAFRGQLDYEGDGGYYVVEAEVAGGESTRTRVPITADGLPKYQSVTVNVDVDGTPKIGTLHE